jgi:hypothetical protein
MTQDYQNIAIKISCEYISVKFIRDLLTTKEMSHKNTDVISAVNLATAYKKNIIKQYKVCDNIIQNLSNKSIGIFRAISTQ